VFAGLRVTRQDPVECLISFLCSSVAPIYRIRRGIDAMCRTLGEPLGTHWGRTFHAFPTLECLAETPREEYDTMGLGFRGGNVRETSAELLRRGGRPYLLALRHAPYANAKAALITLPGVGAKIADCVCLFSLGKHEAVPMDVHVTRIGKRLFPHLASLKSLTSKNYNDLADAYRDRFGPYAGWAQQYLFYNELLMTGAWDRQMGVHVPGRKK
jgi:N-glycosylase/DNA lyase